MALLTGFLTTGPVWAEPTGSSTIAGGNSPDAKKVPQDKRVDLIPGQPIGANEEYTTTPVRQGKLQEVTDSKFLNQQVTNGQGEKLGKITKVLKDEKTQNIEYVMHERSATWRTLHQRNGFTAHNAVSLPYRDSPSNRSPDISIGFCWCDRFEQGFFGGSNHPANR